MLQPRGWLSPSLLVFVCVTTFAVVLRYCFFDAVDPSKCGALLNEGVWLDRQNESAIPKEWQPPGCLIHKYKSTEISTCFKDRRVMFFGDSTIRQIFWAVARKLDKTADESKAEKHSDITVEKDGVKLEFIWDPYLNSSRVQTELDLFDGTGGENKARPSIMLAGTGLWYARFEKMNGFKQWKDRIDEYVRHMRPDGRASTDMTKQDLLLLAPVIVPAWDKLDEERSATITASEIGTMNTYLQQLSDFQGVDVVWSFNIMPKKMPQCYESTGIHLEKSIVDQEAEILLNLRCNSALPSHYPYDKTCCNKYEPPNFQQWVALLYVLAGLPLMLYLKNRGALRRYRESSEFYDSDDEVNVTHVKEYPWLPSERMIHAMIVMGLAVVYCFYADRTQVFNKSQKHYTSSGFLTLTLISLFIGLVSFRKCSKTASDQPFLFRDQTDEWKGWMQAAILIYHYTGASKVAWIYGFIRVTVASYLFMTGYGHTIYFYKKGDYSFKRVAGVLIRLNLLSCILPYIMKTEYIFYYFAPLVSYWFLVVYTTMRIGAKYNKNTRFLLGKIAVSAILSTAFTKIPGILEAVFQIPHFLARTEWDVGEWRFRVFLDMWIVYIGMIVAIAFVKLSENNSPYAARLPTYRKIAILTSLVALPAFFVFQTTRENKFKFIYNAYHPYISWIPILSFVVLRNATAHLRNAHSAAFAWLGRCSLETFTLQFHIWLAADTRGLLDLGIFGNYQRFANFVVATIIFFYVSHRVADATGELTKWIMGVPESRKPPAALPPPAVAPADAANGKEGEASEENAVPLRNFGESSSRGAANLVTAGAEPKNDGWIQKYWGDLRVRCAAILLGMWVLNLTYSP